MKEVAERCGAIAIMVEDDWGKPVDPQKVEDAFKANPDAKMLALYTPKPPPAHVLMPKH